MSSKPTIAIVGGAWHSPQSYWPLVYALSAEGFPVRTVALPSVNHPEPLKASLEEDIAAVRNGLLLPLVDSGTDVLLICHSFGGLVGGIAARGLGKIGRQAAGKSGGIVHLVWISAFVLSEGETFAEAAKVALPPQDFVTLNHPSEGLTVPTYPRSALYADVDDTVASQLEAMLLPQAGAVPGSAAPAPGVWTEAEFDGKRTYLHLTRDQAFLPLAQRAMIDKSGVHWNVIEMEASHSVFASQPLQVVRIVQEVAGSHAN